MIKVTRPLRTDGELTYKRILEAAGLVFATNGFAEATNKSIAAMADVDLASINYHFGSRSGLYQAVLAEAHRRLMPADQLERLVGLDMPATDRLRKLIEVLVDGAIAPNHWHARVLGRELLSPSSHLQTLQQEEILPKLDIIMKLLSEITGIAPGDPALLRCMLSIAAPSAILLVVGTDFNPIAERFMATPREDMIDHLYRFAMGGLAAIGNAQGRPA
jgi:AcrR family transcriptional regulator